MNQNKIEGYDRFMSIIPCFALRRAGAKVLKRRFGGYVQRERIQQANGGL